MVQGQPTTSTVNNSLGIQYQTGFTIMCRVDCGAMYKLFGSSCSTADVRLVRLTHPPICWFLRWRVCQSLLLNKLKLEKKIHSGSQQCLHTWNNNTDNWQIYIINQSFGAHPLQ